MAQHTEFRVGTASWTDPTLIKSDLFYPPSLTTAEDRLRFYAEHFDTVEVDSSYYALLSERVAQAWVKRTPPGFIFNLKAYAMLTQHTAVVARMPRVLREMLPAAAQAAPQIRTPPSPMLALAFQMFNAAAQPLRAAGKLGMMLFQFPPYVTCNPRNLDYLAALPERLPGSEIAVEFRHPSWVVPEERRKQTLNFLQAHKLYYVSVDAPRGPAIVPSFVAASGPQIYMRFHGRNAATWFKKGQTAAERYKYLYAERELAEAAGRLREPRGIERAYVIFNNCYSNFGIMNATTMKQILTHPDPRQ
jgi:uncharacterized protein YecE (DUF72 family)